MKKIGVFVCSRGHTDDIAELLNRLVSQRVPDGWTLHSVNIIWNRDPVPCSRDISEVLSSDFGAEVVEYFEPRIGIPYARNRALDVARSDNFSHLAFIDDDCIPRADWLERLVNNFDTTRADVVAGGWVILPATTPSPWLPEKCFGQQHYSLAGKVVPALSELPTAYTRNVFFDLRVLDLLPPQHQVFPDGLSEVGGSDSLLFARLAVAGARIIYVPEALVDETYADERLTLRWHFLRRVRNTQVRLLRRKETREPLAQPKAIMAAIGVSIFLLPAIVVFFALVFFRKNIKRKLGAGLLIVAPLLGAIIWSLGLEYREYSNTFGFRHRRSL